MKWVKLVCTINDVFVPIFLKIYRALMRWTPWSFFGGEVAMMGPHDGGTHLEWGVEGRGMRALSQILSDMSLSYSLKHISTGEHSLHISCRIIGVCTGNSPVTAGKSPVTCEFPSHRQWRGVLMFSLIYAWTNGWVNNQDADDLRRHRAHYDVTAMWCRIVIQWSGQPRDLSAFNA